MVLMFEDFDIENCGIVQFICLSGKVDGCV
jgi:hypothetical protein